MDIGQLLPVIGGLLGFIALGVILRVSGVLRAEDSRPLNTLLMYVALPALVFSIVRREAIDPSLLAMPAVGWIVALVGIALAWGIARALKLDRPATGAFLLVAVFGNTGYVGYPVASALLGDSGLVRAIFSDVFGNTLVVITVGTVLVSRFGQHSVRVNPFREIVTFPPFIALALGLASRLVTLPVFVSDWLDALGKLVVPVIMVSMGLSLRPRAIRGHLPMASVAAALKLVVLPLGALALGRLLAFDEPSLRIAVLQAGVPSMMLAALIGERFKLDQDLIASAILVTMVGSVVTIPVWQLLLG